MDNKILNVLSNSYKYGFQTKIEKEYFPKGLTENIINLISEKKEEIIMPEFYNTLSHQAH